jgi:hypothetical protein
MFQSPTFFCLGFRDSSAFVARKRTRWALIEYGLSSICRHSTNAFVSQVPAHMALVKAILILSLKCGWYRSASMSFTVYSSLLSGAGYLVSVASTAA